MMFYSPFILPVTTFLILVLLLCIIVGILISSRCRSWTINHLKGVAFTVLIIGWFVYLVGYWQYYDEELNLVALVFRSFLSSIGMFALQSDLQYFVHESVKGSPLFLGIFAVTHFLAALVSAIFVINFVGVKIVSWMKMHRSAGQDLFVFWGMNDNSIALAEDIHKKAVEGLIIFVGTLQDSKEGDRQFSLSALINGQTQRKDRIRRIEEEIDAILTYCIEELPSVEELSTPCNIFNTMGLKSLAKIIYKSNNQHIRFFFLSDNDKKNLASVASLLGAIANKDVCLSECLSLDIYCKSRRNKENSVFEKLAYLKSDRMIANVHLIDSANLSIQILKKNMHYQPISYVDVNNMYAAVESDFSALVIGFDATGRDAVRFLYEFAAFPDRNGEKSPFKCYAVDKKMDELAGSFFNNSPALKENKEIELLKMNVLSEEFWVWFKRLIPQLNYIVIALGNDELGMQLTVDIIELACKYTKQMNRFNIFVRSYSQESEAKQKEIARFYQDKIEANVVTFGKVCDLYTFANVVDEESLKEAIRFYAGYANVADIKEKWEERHLMNGKKKEDISLTDINSVIRKETQDMENSRHVDTKLALVGLNRNSSNSELNALSDIQKRNLAICEHLRWCASLELLGYVYDENTDDLKKTHCCLLPWAMLSEDFRMYDYEVWEQTKNILRDRNVISTKES